MEHTGQKAHSGISPVSSRSSMLLLGFFCCLIYSVLRLKLNYEFSRSTWADMIHAQTGLPFIMRILAPGLCRAIQSLTGFSTTITFGISEFLWSALCFFSLYSLLRLSLEKRDSFLLCLLFFLLLPFLFLLHYRWPIYYPYDTPAMAFAFLGLSAFLRHRSLLFLVLIAFATLNRETALLIPLSTLFLSFGRQDIRKNVLLSASGFLIHFLTRGFLYLLFSDRDGAMMWFYLGPSYRVWVNVCWLFYPEHWPIFLSNLGFMPIAWLALWNYLPRELIRIRFACAFTLIPMFIVGNIYEPRKDGDCFALLFYPFAVALSRWIREAAPNRKAKLSIFGHLEEWGVSLLILTMGLVFLCCYFQVLTWLPNPMPHLGQCLASADHPWTVRPAH